MTPFYNPSLTYEENYSLEHTSLHDVCYTGDIRIPFGIPAGPLLNGNYCQAAFRAGYDVCVYKTVRAGAHPANEFPNILYVHPKGADLGFVEADAGVLTDNIEPRNINDINISNSFGVPSFDPDVWQPDMHAAVQKAGDGQVLVGSFQGLHSFESFVTAAKLVAETGAKVLELNTSCPNEGKDSLLCFDPGLVGDICDAIKQEVGDLPLFIKIAYIRKGNTEDLDDSLLDDLLAKTVVRGTVQGISAINTIPTKLIDAAGNPALPGIGREYSGVCGAGIKWAGLAMTKALDTKRTQLLNGGRITEAFKIAGVGGVMNYADYQAYIDAGADEVLAATGPMWNPHLAIDIKEQISRQNGSI